MNGVDRRGQPGARDGQPQEDSPQEDDGHGVQHHVDGVIPCRREAPQVILDPKRGMYERVILRDRAHLSHMSCKPCTERSAAFVSMYVSSSQMNLLPSVGQ